MNVISGSTDNAVKLVLICRLCGEASNSYINIFGQEGVKHTINKKILSYLKVEVSNSDLLPKVICDSCFHKLKEFHNFFLTSKKVQLLLKNTINDSLFAVKIKIDLPDNENDNDNSVLSVKNDCLSSFDNEQGKTKIEQNLFLKKDTNLSNDKGDQETNKGKGAYFLPTPVNEQNNFSTVEYSKEINDYDKNNDTLEYHQVSDFPDCKGTNMNENSIKFIQKEDESSTSSNIYNEDINLQENANISATDITENSYKEFYYSSNNTVLTENDQTNTPEELDLLNLQAQKCISNSEMELMNITIKLPCASCAQVLTSPVELIHHYNQCHKSSAITFKCNICGRMYKVFKNFYSHYQTHNDINKHICEICGKSFNRNWSLKVHAVVHSDAKPFKCDECNKEFKNLSSLRNHKTSHVPDECKVIYTCAYCGRSCKSKFILTTHERNHTGQKDFTCDICGKSFASKSSLFHHISVHDYSQQVSCHICNKLFRTEKLLKRHVEYHSVNKQFKCDYCGKEYRYMTQLNEHRRLHTGELPYKCEYCTKRFRLRSTLIIHRRQHTGVKPYRCKVCERSFTNWPNYNKHMKRKHYNTIVKEKDDELILLKI